MQLKKIGIIHSPYKEIKDAPKQGRYKDDEFTLEIFEEYEEGLKDIEGVTHLIVLYWLDKANRNKLIAHPPWDGKPHGVFSTRSPSRPNPIAFDIVDLIKKDGRYLHVKKMDALDESAILDIK